MVSAGSLLGSFFLLIILVVILSVVGTTTVVSNVVNLVDGSSDIFEILFQGSLPKPEPREGELVCDLKITIYSELDQDVPLTPFHINIGNSASDPRVKEYHWDECHDAQAIPIGSLLDIADNVNTLSFFPVGINADFTVPIELELVDANGNIISCAQQRNLCREIPVQEGLITLPFDLTDTFAVQNIPHRDYQLRIFYPEHQIDAKPIGTPFVDEVCTFDQEIFPCI